MCLVYTGCPSLEILGSATDLLGNLLKLPAVIHLDNICDKKTKPKRVSKLLNRKERHTKLVHQSKLRKARRSDEENERIRLRYNASARYRMRAKRKAIQRDKEVCRVTMAKFKKQLEDAKTYRILAKRQQPRHVLFIPELLSIMSSFQNGTTRSTYFYERLKNNRPARRESALIAQFQNAEFARDERGHPTKYPKWYENTMNKVR